MTMQFTEWMQNPSRAVFKDDEENFLVSSKAAVFAKAASGLDDGNFMEPRIEEAKKAIAALNAMPALKTP